MTKLEAAKIIASRDPRDYSEGGVHFGKAMCDGLTCKDCYLCNYPENAYEHQKEAQEYVNSHGGTPCP